MTGEPLVPRVRGLETEYGLSLRLDTGRTMPDGSDAAQRWRRVGSDEAARRLFAPVVEATATTNVWLRNGGRLYLDVGSHPEYATPECRTIGDLIAHDRAGDAIVNRLADRALEAAASEGTPARISVLKNNLDSHGNSYGSHENYQISRHLDYDELGAAFTGFLATRQLLCGAGRWVRTGRGSWFEMSQRAEHMWEPVASSTTRSRPFINTRDEPHADPALHRRLHVVVGDSTLNQRTLLLRIGATELVLRAIEAGERFGDLRPADPAAAIRQCARDLSGRRPIELVGGGSVAPLDLQRVHWQRAAPFVDGDPELASAHALWGEVLDALDAGDLARIGADVDWVGKYLLLQAFRERHRDATDARMAQLDLAWHDIRPGQGLFAMAEAAGRTRTVLDAGAVDRAVEQPPADTRAALRSRFLTAAQVHQRTYTVDWMSFVCHDLTDATVICRDPLATTDERVDRIIERMATEPRSGPGTRFRMPMP